VSCLNRGLFESLIPREISLFYSCLALPGSFPSALFFAPGTEATRNVLHSKGDQVLTLDSNPNNCNNKGNSNSHLVSTFRCYCFVPDPISDVKTVFINLVRYTASNPIAWIFYRGCLRLSNYLDRIYRFAQSVRSQGDAERLCKITAELFPDLTVRNGLFRGLKYPLSQSVGSELLPKLLGSYESELHPVLDEMLEQGYNTIVDIGCAEGYYAIGFALRLPHAEVYAFDTNPTAKQLCAEMGRLNGVGERLHIEDFCSEETLRSIPLGDRGLIISDCEGYEGLLFNRGLAEFLVKHDVIIETHDFIDIDLSAKMRNAFAKTHHIRSIKSVDDIEKAHTCHDRMLDPYSTRDKYLALTEKRPAIMEWLVMTSKKVHASAGLASSP
jgi:precorrin-6B methylase 2